MKITGSLKIIKYVIGHPATEKIFENQEMEIIHTEPTLISGASSIEGIVFYPTTIKWKGGDAKILDYGTIEITDNSGVVTTGTITKHYFAARNSDNGVEFQIE